MSDFKSNQTATGSAFLWKDEAHGLSPQDDPDRMP